MKRIAWILLLLAMAVPGWAKNKIVKKTIEFQGRVRTYSLYVPDFVDPLPVVLILHGYSYSEQYGQPGDPIPGSMMVNSWRDLASREHFIVVAPNETGPRPSDFWDGDWSPPAFFRALIEQVDAQHPVDGSRVYLFGDDEGAQYALSVGILDANFYAAVAAHAGALNPDYSSMFARAPRRIPIALLSGSFDAVCPLNRVRKSNDLLVSNGFPVELNIIPNHAHDYFTIDSRINEMAWKFLKKTQLKLAQGK